MPAPLRQPPRRSFADAELAWFRHQLAPKDTPVLLAPTDDRLRTQRPWWRAVLDDMS